MNRHSFHFRLIVAICVLAPAGLGLTASAARAGQLGLSDVVVPASYLNVPLETTIEISFDQAVLTSSISNATFHVFGRWTGPVAGTFSFGNGNTRVIFTPSRVLSAGDSITVFLSHGIQAADGSPFRAAGYTFRFWTKASPATMEFNVIDTFGNCSDPCLQTRIYGAAGTDMNNDGWLDLSTVNEVSSDLRVFLNRADGTGLYNDFIEPVEPLNYESSPNDPADFNKDGKADLCIGSSATGVISVLLGNGDGTFAPQQTVDVGAGPHGVAVLDVEGDGDIDIVSSNTDGDNCSLLLNNGAGLFAPAINFEGGGAGEYAMGSGDMNNDGIFDLVVGCRYTMDVIIHLGNGNGTFTALPPKDADGLVWMLSVADVNGDGNEDVLTSNSGSDTGSVLLGNGTGGLGTPSTVATAHGAIATDVGDLDGDGDLDWLISSFGGGAWRVYRNNGAGVFTQLVEFEAPSNPSCSIILDIDNDRDLDLVLTDEIADLVVLRQNRGPLVYGDMNCDGLINGRDIGPFVQAVIDSVGYRAAFTNCEIMNGDVNNDTAVDTDDLVPFAELVIGG